MHKFVSWTYLANETRFLSETLTWKLFERQDFELKRILTQIAFFILIPVCLNNIYDVSWIWNHIDQRKIWTNIKMWYIKVDHRTASFPSWSRGHKLMQWLTLCLISLTYKIHAHNRVKFVPLICVYTSSMAGKRVVFYFGKLSHVSHAHTQTHTHHNYRNGRHAQI